VNVYASFVRPNKEIERKALFIWLTRANAAMNGLTGEWQASTHQLVERLHAEVGDIEGAVEISYPAPEAPEYARRLVAATPEANVLCAAPNAPTVHVTADNTLKVMVGYNDETGGRAVVCPPPPPQLQPQPAPGPSSATAPPVAGVSPTVQWLITEAAKDARYASFKAGRHHVLTNPGVVSSWQFAVEFSKKHSGMPSPVAQPTVGGRGRKRPPRIKKSEVQQALGIGSSWMSDAHRAMTLRWKFGEGGTSPRQDVIRVCTSTAEDDRMGARALLGYLAEQEH
jgi:hypothetical protein